MLALDEKYIIELKNINKIYRTTSIFKGSKLFYALKNINIKIKEHDRVGIAGQSGSGKTTLCKIISQTEKPESGQFLFNGEDITSKRNYLKSKIQFIFQDPNSSLNPRMKIKDTVAEPLLIRKEKKELIEKRVREVIEEVGLNNDVLEKYPHQLSGGQKQRIAIARAIITKPEILIADEPISSLDISISAQILNLLKDIHRKEKFTLIFVSHDIASIYFLTDSLYILYRGEIMEYGETDKIIKKPHHPYTKLLISSILDVNSTQNRKRIDIKERKETNSKCIFSNLCPEYSEKCIKFKDEYTEVNEGHFVKCINYGKDN